MMPDGDKIFKLAEECGENDVFFEFISSIKLSQIFHSRYITYNKFIERGLFCLTRKIYLDESQDI